MPRRRAFDKKNATTFQLVHRAQNDPLIHDDTAPSMVFAEKTISRRPTEEDYAYTSAGSVASSASYYSYRSHKTKQRGDLEDEFGMSVRKNEGEAAQHGVFYDDTRYDYMQHMKDLGTGEGAVTWVEANVPKDKGKKRADLADTLRSMELDDDFRSVGQSSTTSSIARNLLPEEVLPSEFVTRRSYQDQQDVPDEIAGFQPDMDPRLREVLEALEDEEYVDDDEDIFGELTGDGYEVAKDEWDMYGEQEMFGEEDAGWESDDTIKAPNSPVPAPLEMQLLEGEDAAPPEDPHAVPTADPTQGAWLDEFKKFKAGAKVDTAEREGVPIAPSTLDSSALSSLATGRRKKRKGAKTSTTNYSMTSSSIARTDPLTTLDERFDKMEAKYTMAEFPEDEEDDYLADNGSMASGMTGLSKASKVSKYSNVSGLSGVSRVSSYSRAADEEAPQLVRSDFNGIMDEFLGNHSKVGKHGQRVRRGAPKSGMEELDELRSGLGPARIKGNPRGDGPKIVIG